MLSISVIAAAAPGHQTGRRSLGSKCKEVIYLPKEELGFPSSLPAPSLRVYGLRHDVGRSRSRGG